MTTPAISSFHQKIFPHAKSATFAKDFSYQKNNPFRLYPDSVGALRPLRAKARPGNAGREPSPAPHAKSAKRGRFSALSFLKFRISHFSASRNRGAHFAFPTQIPPFRPWRPLREQSAFTLIELLAVITVIGILAGLTLGAAGAVRRHGATSTAKAEVAALQAACDRYYADNSAYPIGTASPTTVTAPAGATALFTNLFGTNQYNLPPSTKRYFEPKPAMVFTNTSPNHFIDPWANAYGYNSDGTNAPLIWSTAGQTKASGTNKWITSWPKL